MHTRFFLCYHTFHTAELLLCTNDLVEFCTQQTELELNPVHESGAKYGKLYVTKFFIDLSEVLNPQSLAE